MSKCKWRYIQAHDVEIPLLLSTEEYDDKIIEYHVECLSYSVYLEDIVIKYCLNCGKEIEGMK